MKLNRQQKREQTRQRIILGLFELMLEKNYADITVKAICKQANVSRMTFYRNFHTKEEVIKGQFEMVYDHFIQRLATQKYLAFYDVATTFFTLIKENKLMMEALVQNNLTNLLLESLSTYIKTLVDQQILITREQSSQFLVAMISGGLTEVIVVWTKNDMQQSVEELVIFASKYMHLK
ncbi:TetR/AcrR family transcriptional regulator [Fructilactobacillus carniphilus]|uniref:TetR/AcrR family transcriptional regulator n=1 Tax=Fructilactobacillus carniphilus TaxID=2940297 RepID=A0ABY5BWN3_9LACO|nr:TetR/AcrR family transcriptional regulator [Fructilactobacillus carniphilus]USS90240.1 TetR/AcrR family transcriptional regulator [Fructilactobacillus carniphilus]